MPFDDADPSHIKPLPEFDPDDLIGRTFLLPPQKRWAETLHDFLKDMNFAPSRADRCIWLKKNIKLNLYEYIAVYVDDLCIAAQDPKEIINILKSKYKLKLKEMDH